MAVIIWAVISFCSRRVLLKIHDRTVMRLDGSHRLAMQQPKRMWCEIGIITVALIIIASPLYYEFPNYGMSKVVTFDGDKVIEHPFGTFAWEFGKTYSNVPTKNTTASSGVTSVTENHEVRNLRYTVGAQITNAERFFAEKNRRLLHAAFSLNSRDDVDDAIEQLVFCQLIEFNHLFSKQLVQFYNPLDVNQQQAFKTLIESQLNGKLAKEGISVRSSNFKIE